MGLMRLDILEYGLNYDFYERRTTYRSYICLML